MVRWRLKSCPKCGGDLLIERDMDYWYELCLQCSYRKELKPVHEYKEQAAETGDTAGNEVAVGKDS